MSILRLPRHRATTAQLCSAYPFQAEAGLGARGVYLGTNLLTGGGGFVFDPFEAYDARLVTNPNMLVAGEPGTGKSATVKSFLYRSVGVFGRWAAVVDPKGEYTPIADALGMTVLKLHPGGATRVNPLDPGPASTIDRHDDVHRQHAMVDALLGAVLGRDLDAIEDAAVGWALTGLASRVDRPTLADLAAVLAAPTGEMAARTNDQPQDLARRVEAVTFALGKLIDRDLRGMFDGRTTTAVDWQARGVVLDVSAVYHDQTALTLVMIAATAWLQTFLATPGPRRLQVLDEAWALLADLRTARYLQACWKLGRAFGVANVAVVHRLSDLRAQADDGSATAKVTAGLLADTQTRVVFRQAHDQIPDATGLLGLTGTEAQLLTRFVPHRALWKIGQHTAVVHHNLSAEERRLTDTDAAMRA